MLSFLQHHNIIRSSQHGFLPGRSSLSALLDFLEDVTNLTDSGSPVDAIYFDFQKAFDSVPHRRLLKKVEACGISDPLLQWIDSFLTNRYQRVVLRNAESPWLSVNSGVPQGSVLGPLLFLIFINDIDTCCTGCFVTKFADDIKIYANANLKSTSLQIAVDNIVSWASTWQLNIHPDKCSVLHFGRSNPMTKYLLNGSIINNTPFTRDLGVFIDKDLKCGPTIVMLLPSMLIT